MLRKILVLFSVILFMFVMLTACSGGESSLGCTEETVTKIEGNRVKTTTGEMAITETGKEEDTTSNWSDASVSTVVPEEKTSVHQHNYSSSVAVQPSCAEPGKRVYTCICGDSYTERIAPTGNHSWQKQYRMQTIPEQSHVKRTWGYICNDCDTMFETGDEAHDHIMSQTCRSYTFRFKEETVIDAPEHTEQICIGSKCAVCGEWEYSVGGTGDDFDH